jgi:predicted MFS family arabinose efflux permease
MPSSCGPHPPRQTWKRLPSQIPGRVLFGPLAGRLREPLATAAVFALVAVGIGLVVGLRGTAAVLTGLVLVGMGNGMATLARATIIADRYRPGAYATIAGVAASVTTAARAAGPIAAALWASLVGYSALLWTLSALAALAAALGYRAQRAPRPQHLRGRGRAA